MSTLNILQIDTSADYCHSDHINRQFGDSVRTADGFEIINRNETSWTASRVGVTAVKAWAFATGKPVYQNGTQIDIRKLDPYYNSEFKVTIKSHKP